MEEQEFAGHKIPQFQLLKGDCLVTLKTLDDNSIDSVVCDPPYHLQSIVKRFGSENAAEAKEGSDGLFQRASKGFMGKTWDGGDIAFRTDVWKECFRVLKPGGHLIAFGGTRTIHRITCAIEDSGFEIRDMINWLYFSGFPKSHNVSIMLDKQFGDMKPRGHGVKHAVGQENLDTPQSSRDGLAKFEPKTPEAIKWHGWGTALKPSQEPAILARKPLEKGLTVAKNMMKFGTGALNIDACRFKADDPCWVGPKNEIKITRSTGPKFRMAHEQMDNGGFNDPDRVHEIVPNPLGRWPANIYQCAKPGRQEKESGLDNLIGMTASEALNRKPDSKGLENAASGSGRTSQDIKNTHPTVKPTGIMRWLCRLVTPPGGIVLDPFLGSGTTAVSAIQESFNVIGCELTPEYWPIIQGRIDWSINKWKDDRRQYKLF